MASGSNSGLLRQFRTLFEEGTVAGLTDGQLLERFLSRRDRGGEVAFEALVARHGPMVLGVCRRALPDPNDAADAFQATFLVLVRKARSVRVDDSLGRWLYGVSRRVAGRARVVAARRAGAGSEEIDAIEAASTDPDRFELVSLLDEELARLPEAFRSALVLCDLEGLTHEEAARDLRCPVGTIKSRLARGRERLRARLERRGLAPASLMVAPAVPASLAEAAVRVSLRSVVAGKSAAGVVPASAVALAEGVLKSMTGFKLKLAAAAVLSLGVVASGAGVLTQGQKEDGKPPVEEVRKNIKGEDPAEIGIVSVDSRSSQKAKQLARESFPQGHWATGKDLKFTYHDAERGFTMYAQDYEQLKDGKQILIRPFALVWVSKEGQKRTVMTSQEAIIDFSQPLAMVKPGAGPSRIAQLKMLGDVLVRDDTGTSVIRCTELQLGPFSSFTFDDNQAKPRDKEGGRAAPIEIPDRVETKLNAPVSLNIQERPLGEVLALLSDQTQLNIVLEPKSLTEIGVTSRTPVTLTADKITLKDALKYLLRPLRLTFKVEDEAVVIIREAPQDQKLAELRHSLDQMEKKLAQAQRLARSPQDPAIIRARQKVAELEAAIAERSKGLAYVQDGAPEPAGAEPPANVGRKQLSPLSLKNEPPRELRKVTLPDYVVEPPDILVVELLEALPGRPITGERLVRPDGTISLGFYGDVSVAGLTTTQIKAKVALHLRGFIKDENLGLVTIDQETGKVEKVEPSRTNRVFVDVAAYNSKVYYVQGEVASPSRLPITGNETVLDAINFAGGLKPELEKARVRLVRPVQPGLENETTLLVDLPAIINQGQTGTNYQVLPGDRVIVDRDPKIAALDLEEARQLKRKEEIASKVEGRVTPDVEARLQTLERKLDEVLKALEHLPKP